MEGRNSSMYVITGITMFVYLAIWISSRKEHLPENMDSGAKERWMRPFMRMAYWMVKKIYGRGKQQKGCCEAGRWESRQVVRDLSVLYPSRENSARLQQYYVKKMAFSMIILLAGTLLATVVYRQEQGQKLLEGNNQIPRGDYREEEDRVQLNASVEGYEDWKFELQVGGKMPEREEADGLEKEFWELMMSEALGENASWNQVYEDLKLAEGLDGYPFYVEWSSESPHIIDWEGNVSVVEEMAEGVTLTACVSLKDWEWQHTLTVTVIPRPLTEEESIYRELQEYIRQLEQNTSTESVLVLPEAWQEKTVTWKEEVEDYSIFLWLIAVAAGVSVFFLQDRDLHTRVQEREQRLKEAYPVIVNKLVLYLGAGLTIRGALMHMAQTYDRGQEPGRKEEPVYEEILCTCRELQTGTSEPDAYEKFGKRCGLQEYVRLSALLSQNLRRGSGTLPARLREEADLSEREQINECRRKGEEVSTKLLIPMVMMLGMVMVMIMIPAFTSM